ncbi:aminopeptidase [Clostridium sp. Marseille-QA1073]
MEKMLKKYARLAVKTGVNIQKNQTLIIASPIECAPFTRMISEAAYKEGAREVIIDWNDELSTKIKYMYADDEVLSTIAPWKVDSLMHYVKNGAAVLSISASDPELMKDVPSKKISASIKASQLAFKEFNNRLTNYKNRWSILSIPTKSWASKVFPELLPDKAVEKLWEEIFKLVRVDKEDPVKAWEEHIEVLKSNRDLLNNQNLKSLHFKNSLGTDLYVNLPQNHLWMGGSKKSSDDIEFVANMPTEEIFTLPKRNGVNGIVYSSKPLNYSGKLIEDFSLTFENGKIIDFTAKKGYDSLKNLITTDEGSHYLGEVALVPFNSSISNSGLTFFNTLYDENASCHLAIGKAYNLSIKDGDKMTDEEFLKVGGNISLIHVDFMFGTEDLEVIGVNQNGELIQIFKNGNWIF